MKPLVLPIALLFAAALGCQHVDSLGMDDSQRIEDVMRPPPAGEPLPEGIALGLDAPPLAPAWPEPPYGVSWGRALPWPGGGWGGFGPGCIHGTMRGPGCEHRRGHGSTCGHGAMNGPGCGHGPFRHPGPMTAPPNAPEPSPGLAPPTQPMPPTQPGGSTPGLLP